ncbi:protein SMAX1-LIKE 7-like isoform X2 [Rutidosis leptorrhynchoides]|uniref:protein SMAX1-LIKE 7-like isoform X2 n=1 Tax=Rutidosis leptorrhynchoides TaxID=125765 RepID=UPI003A98F919
MPTPVSTARQCLTDESVRALNDAVSVARRRSHSQTTSLHAVSALLSLQPTSILRDACARARSSAYSPRLQFRALDLCVSVSLDRLPSSKSKTGDDEPPVSNSLMAAIKRSQANQRRHPETFHLYQMHQQLYSGNQTTSLSCVKVELKHFVLSILDDPIVSRVFGDAGFRSTDVKIAILHPPNISGFSKSVRLPSLFTTTLNELNYNSTGFCFPFAVDETVEDYKRIGSVLAKKASKNPLLIGGSANSVVNGFIDCLKKGGNGYLPNEIEGLDVVGIDMEIGEFVSGRLSEEMVDLKMKEVKEKVDNCEKCGVIVSFGELKLFYEGGSMEFVVSRLSDLVRVCGGKLWLIGSVASYEIYMKIVAKFVNIEKDWDLNLVPVTSSTLSTNGLQMKSSLMGSFVPFGGFFPGPNEMGNSSSKTDESTRCGLCNEKYKHEVSVVMNGGRTVSVADQQSTGLASWMRIPEADSAKVQAVGHGGVINAQITGLRKKWNEICHRIHQNSPSQQNSSQIRARLPFLPNFQPDCNIREINGQDSNQATRCSNPSPPVNFFAKTKHPASITTDLGLGPTPPAHETHISSFNESREVDEVSKHGMNEMAKDYKQLYCALADKVGYQNDSIRAISQTIARCRTANGRRHVWLMLTGSDRVGKKKISTALAEVIFGSEKNMVSIDLNFENQTFQPESIFKRQSSNISEISFRGKSVTDFIAEELTKTPQSVVFLEHIDKADFMTQDNLSRAIKTGRLSDTNGRETRITEAIFVTTTSSSQESDDVIYSEERILNAKALEISISVGKNEALGSSSVLVMPKESVFKSPEMSKKRKIVEIDEFEIMVPKFKKLKSCFDLNLPLEEPEESDNETGSDTKEVWLEEFTEQVDEKVVFDPFDFNSCAEIVLKVIGKCFRKVFGTNVVLEIENEVMVQLLASYWLSDRKGGVENWVESVLYGGFMGINEKQRVDSESMVKLAAVEGIKIENDDALCVCLPSRIMLK